ncbi:MAG TPA: hypothetical protein VMF29_04975 [Candidatus Edwardsbacteria bacterium]|nr:hypothetical protein [Candidatus Edwardsbacteria bacterium]
MKRLPIVALILLAAVSCSKNPTQTPAAAGGNASEDLANGWAAFSNGYFSQAQPYFESAIGEDASLADAYNGKGWCQGILRQPAAALASFRAGLTQPGSNNEIKAGLAFAYAALDSPAQAATRAQEVLAADSLWRFSHTYRASQDAVLDYRELRLLLAQTCFKQGQFAAALAWVQKLNPSFTADVGTATGQAALQAEIEWLATIF